MALLDSVRSEEFKMFTWNIETAYPEGFEAVDWAKLFKTMHRLRERALTFEMAIVLRRQSWDRCDGIQELVQAQLHAHDVPNVELRQIVTEDDL
jgi:hypothetical protein